MFVPCTAYISVLPDSCARWEPVRKCQPRLVTVQVTAVSPSGGIEPSPRRSRSRSVNGIPTGLAPTHTPPV